MSRSLTAPQVTLLEGAHRAVHTRVWVATALGALVDYSDYLLPGTVIEEGVDELVNALTLHFDRSLGESSLAPLMTVDPPIEMGREVMFEVAVTSLTAAPVSGDWFEKFRGKIRSVDPTNNDMVVVAQDQAGALQDRYVKAKDEEYGDAEGSETVEDVIQELLARWDTGETLYAPVASEAGVTPYKQQVETVLQASRAIAESIGWTTRYWWDDTEDEYRFTLIEPPRGKTVADWTMSPSRYLEVRELRQDVEDIRNLIVVRYVDEDGAQLSIEVRDEASITKYGERYLEIVEGSASPIKTVEQATALGTAALADLGEPDATHTVEDFFLPHIELWDLLEFEANDVHYSTDQSLAVMTVRHEFPAPGVGRTVLGCRGKPSGGVLMWRRRAQAGKLIEATTIEPAWLYGFTRFEEVETGDPLLRRWEYEAGPRVHSVWGAIQTYDYPLTVDAEDAIKALVEDLGALSGTIELDATSANKAVLARVEPRYEDPDGNLVIYDSGPDLVQMLLWYAEPAKIHGLIDARYEVGVLNVYALADPTQSALPIAYEVRADSKTGTLLASGSFATIAAARTGVGPSDDVDLGGLIPPADGKKVWWAKFVDVAGNVEWATDSVENPVKPQLRGFRQLAGSTPLTTDLSVVVYSPLGRYITLRAWVNKVGTTSPDPAAAPDSTLAIPFTAGTPASYTVTAADSFVGALTLFNEVAVFPGIGKVVYLEAVDDLGMTTGVQAFVIHTWSTIQRADGTIIDDAIDRPAAFAASIRPLEALATRPVSGDYTGHRVAALDTGLAWEWNGATWDALESGVDGFYYMPFVVADSISTRELAAFAATFAKLNVARVFVSGMTLTNDSPGAGSVAWSANSLTFEGVQYNVAGGNTAEEVIWWSPALGSSGTVFQTSNTADLVADGFDGTRGDTVIAINEGGDAREIWNGTLIYGGQIVTDAIKARHIDVVDLSAINADLGEITAGLLRNAANTNFWDLNADTDASTIAFQLGVMNIRGDGSIFIGDGIEISAGGDVTISGELDAATGTFAGTLTAEHVDLETGGDLVLRPEGFFTSGRVEWWDDDDALLAYIVGNPTGLVLSADGDIALAAANAGSPQVIVVSDASSSEIGLDVVVGSNVVRMSVGAANSGGSGWRMVRVLNAF